MKQVYKKSILLILLFSCLVAFSQTKKLTKKAEISVITCGPGSELYTAFGHSAFRIKDTALGIDKIYNYGIFDFNQPNFYGNFLKGNMLYLLGTSDTSRFLKSYYYEKRWVKGQVLDLKTIDIQRIYEYLENNALPKNREYFYNYFFDNCSTRIVDVLNEVFGNKIIHSKKNFDNPLTHRELMQLYLGNQPWGDFGIDLCLGAPIDRKATSKEYLFLPENVFSYFDALKIKENGVVKPIVKRTEIILPKVKKVVEKTSFRPIFLFTLIGLFIISITRRNIKKGKRSKWLDFSIYFSTGLIGLMLLFIWFATNHISAKNNFNVLWAFAPNLFVSFFLLKDTLPSWIQKYNMLLVVLLLILVIIWVLKIQVLSIATLPIILFLGVRYYYLWKSTDL